MRRDVCIPPYRQDRGLFGFLCQSLRHLLSQMPPPFTQGRLGVQHHKGYGVQADRVVRLYTIFQSFFAAVPVAKNTLRPASVPKGRAYPKGTCFTAQQGEKGVYGGERTERRQWRMQRGERVAAVKISSARRKTAQKFWEPQQDSPFPP